MGGMVCALRPKKVVEMMKVDGHHLYEVGLWPKSPILSFLDALVSAKKDAILKRHHDCRKQRHRLYDIYYLLSKLGYKEGAFPAP